MRPTGDAFQVGMISDDATNDASQEDIHARGRGEMRSQKRCRQEKRNGNENSGGAVEEKWIGQGVTNLQMRRRCKYHADDGTYTTQGGNSHVNEKTLEAEHHRLRVRSVLGKGTDSTQWKGISPTPFPCIRTE